MQHTPEERKQHLLQQKELKKCKHSQEFKRILLQFIECMLLLSRTGKKNNNKKP
jgi:hypothetical protein